MSPIDALRGYEYRFSSKPPLVSVEDYRRCARRRLPNMVWTFLENGADDEVTLERNHRDFRRWRLRQRALAGLTATDLSVHVGGQRLDLPVALSPTGLSGLFHWHGEAGAARAAERCGTRHVMSTYASYSIEEVAAGTQRSHWFQLYPWADEEFMGTMLDRARRADFGALFVTVDVPVIGNREGERRVGMGVRPVLTPRRLLDGAIHPRWSFDYLRHQRFVPRNLAEGGGARAAVRALRGQAARARTPSADPRGLRRSDLVSWRTLAWLREKWAGPLYVKGITEPEDADRCVELGCDGVVVSNHGGRQLDTVVSSIGALPVVADAISGRAEVLIDGGIRRGTDVVKALCLGATACMIGRPCLYGLSVGGEDGVMDILSILRTEIETTLNLMGCPAVTALDRSWIEPADDVPLEWSP